MKKFRLIINKINKISNSPWSMHFTESTKTDLFWRGRLLILGLFCHNNLLVILAKSGNTATPYPSVKQTQTRVYVEEEQTHAAVCRSCQVIINSFAHPAIPAVSIAVRGTPPLCVIKSLKSMSGHTHIQTVRWQAEARFPGITYYLDFIAIETLTLLKMSCWIRCLGSATMQIKLSPSINQKNSIEQLLNKCMDYFVLQIKQSVTQTLKRFTTQSKALSIVWKLILAK